MKEIRVKFTEEEYDWLRWNADQLGATVEEMTHDRALCYFFDDPRLAAVQILTEEMGQVREALNQRIKRETEEEIRLYEDNMIRMELEVGRMEGIVAGYVAKVLKEVA